MATSKRKPKRKSLANNDFGVTMTAATKKKLKDKGVWEEFVDVRRTLAKVRGCSQSKLNDEVAEIVLARAGEGLGDPPELGDEVPDESGETAPPSKDKYPNFGLANMREAVAWVFHYVDVKDVPRSAAPSQGAWAFLKWARKPSNLSDFYKSFCSKLLPTRAQLEKEAEFQDDGDEVLDEIEKKLRALGEESAGKPIEGQDGESDVLPRED